VSHSPSQLLYRNT